MDDAPDRVDQSVLDDLRARLAGARRGAAAPGSTGGSAAPTPTTSPTSSPTGPDGYDWRAHEERLRALPWVSPASTAAASDAPARPTATAPAVVLLHGWPDSFLRFDRVLPLLDDLDVVVPACPATRSRCRDPPGMSTNDMAEVVADALAELGYDLRRLRRRHRQLGRGAASPAAPRPVSALHLTDVPYSHLFAVDPDELTQAERDYLDAGRTWRMAEGAYALEQATKPHTLAAALGDSPAGLLAWIVEKLAVERQRRRRRVGVSREELLTWITLYWVTGAIGTSFAPTPRTAGRRPGQRRCPAGVTMFPKDLVPAPREFAERCSSTCATGRSSPTAATSARGNGPRTSPREFGRPSASRERATRSHPSPPLLTAW